ncbi:MAG: nuclear transport factor 2 family protein [Streptosporangiaceae bacterium]
MSGVLAQATGESARPVPPLALHDRSMIVELLASVAYLLDAHEYDRFGEVFTTDIDFSNPGRLVAHGLPAVVDAFKAITQPAISHHITNVVVTSSGPDSASCLSKALTVRSTGITAAEYRDLVRREPDGWRIYSRSIVALG